LCNCSLFNN